MDSDEHGDPHGAAFKMALFHVLFEADLSAAWAFSDKADVFLKRLWEATGEGIDEQDRRDAAGLAALRTYEEKGYLVRIIQCPEPRHLAQNYFVAVAWKQGHRSILPWKNKPEEVRYLALESSVRMMGMDGPPSILGEWTVTGHTNYGDGPEPREEAFVEAIKPILANTAPIEASLNI
jgi:hypothetical protein